MEIVPPPDRRPVPLPDDEPTDEERAGAVENLQRAVGHGRLTLGEFVDRVDVVLAAPTRAELAEAIRDLPPDVPVVGRSSPPALFSVFGDVRVKGRWRLPERTRAVTVFGDVRLDLRDSVCEEPEVRIEGSTVFGTVEVIVPEGVEAELTGFTLFGDRRLELAPVPRRPQTPLVRVHGRTVFGDLRVRSLAPGESASAWRRALDRWRSKRPSALPPTPPPPSGRPAS